MRIKALLGPLMVAAGIMACSDVTAPARSISPTALSSHATTYDCSDPDSFCSIGDDGLPPPPSLDTISVMSDAFGAMIAEAPVVHVQYFMNKPQNNAWITFKGQTSSDVLASANARISVHQGTVSGKGTLTILMPGSAVLSIDLSKGISGKSTFNGDCSKGCGSVLFTGVLTPKVGKASSFSGALLIAPPLVPIIDHG